MLHMTEKYKNMPMLEMLRMRVKSLMRKTLNNVRLLPHSSFPVFEVESNLPS